jgi:hypothetical protein
MLNSYFNITEKTMTINVTLASQLDKILVLGKLERELNMAQIGKLVKREHY